MNGSSALGAAMTYHNEHAGPDPQVNSVNGKTGDVVLNASDIKDSDDITLQKRILTSGNTIPSGEYVGQLHILLVDITQASGTVKKGLYRYDGSEWELKANETEMVNYGTGTTNQKTREQLLSAVPDKTNRAFLHLFTSAEVPSGGSSGNSHISIVKKFSSTYGVIETYNVNTGNRFISIKISGTWSNWKSLTNVLPYERNLTGKTRAELFALIDETENDSKMFSCTFASSDLPTGCTTSNRFGVYIYKNNSTYGSIIAVKGSGDAEIFKSDLTGGTWGDWKELLSENSQIATIKNRQTALKSGLTRDTVSTTFKSGQNGSITGTFTASESPDGSASTNFLISIEKRWDEKWSMIKAVHCSSGKIYTSTLNRVSSTSAAWTAWKQLATDEDSGWLTLTTGVMYRKKGHLVEIKINSYVATVGASAVTIGTLPSGYRTDAVLYGIAYYVENNEVKFCRLHTGTSGAVALQYGPGTSQTYFGTFSYLV